MGRLNSSGARPLTLADTAILGELLDKCFDTRRSIDAYDGSPPYKSLTIWVDTIAIPHFRNKRRITNEKGEPVSTPEEDKQIRNWYKNQCTRHRISVQRVPVADEDQKATEIKTDTSGKLPCIRKLVVDKYRDKLTRSLRGPDGSSPPNYLRSWNQAVNEKIDSLSTAERQMFQSQVDEEVAKRTLPPPRTEILASQSRLCPKVTGAVQNLLGWERNQYGDAMCFMTIAYRDSSNEIQEKNFMVSNDNNFIECCRPFTERYNSYMSGHFAAVAEVALPSHDIPALAPPVESNTTPLNGTPLAPTTTSEPAIIDQAAKPPGSPVETTTVHLNSTPATLTATTEPAIADQAANPPDSPVETTTAPLIGKTSMQTTITEPTLIQVANLPFQQTVRPFFHPGSTDTSHDRPPAPLSELTTTSLDDPNPNTAPQPQVHQIDAPSPPLLHSSDVLEPEFRAATSLGQHAFLAAAPSPGSNLSTILVQAPTFPPHSPHGTTDSPQSVDPSLIIQECEPVPTLNQKARQKRGKVGSQAVRTSTRSTRVPKQPQPLANKVLGPQPKVPVKDWWAYMSEEESSPQPHRKKARRY